jgi:hypothetical protein
MVPAKMPSNPTETPAMFGPTYLNTILPPPPDPCIINPTMAISDEFSHLKGKLSRQRLKQLRNVRDGKCASCGASPLVTKNYCARCAKRAAEHCRSHCNFNPAQPNSLNSIPILLRGDLLATKITAKLHRIAARGIPISNAARDQLTSAILSLPPKKNQNNS